MEHDYSLRGKCRPMAEALVAKDSTLTLVRGYYHCPFWGKQAHWWAKDPQGKIIDPTAAQFPSLGMGIYEEFNGIVECAQCGKEMEEENVGHAEGRYAFCSSKCFGRFVGVY